MREDIPEDARKLLIAGAIMMLMTVLLTVVNWFAILEMTGRFSSASQSASLAAFLVPIVAGLELRRRGFFETTAPLIVLACGMCLITMLITTELTKAMQFPVRITMPADLCTAITASYDKANAPTAERIPCEYTAYTFPSYGTGIYVYGVSANVKGKCFFVERSSVSMSNMNPDSSEPRLIDLPKQCAGQLPDMIAAVPPRRW